MTLDRPWRRCRATATIPTWMKGFETRNLYIVKPSVPAVMIENSLIGRS